jgi:aminoglycoside phosphotransferase (APT) family kinase protein
MQTVSPEPDVRGLVRAQMPGYGIDSVTLLGEGQENIAYVVNDELIVRFSKASDAQQRAGRVRREASVLAAVAGVSPLPVPVPVFTVVEQGCLAYFKVPGVPLADVPPQQRVAQAEVVGAALGRFLGAMHAMPVERMADLVDTDADPLSDWRRDAADGYSEVAGLVPPRYRRAIEAFLDASLPDDPQPVVFLHNDLGVEHVLVEPGTWRVTGIIDWSDAAIDDPAYDFGLLYRDLGPLALEAAIGSYRPDPTDVGRLRQRAVFYARCSVFEDLAYGLEAHQARYIDNSLAALEWLFAAGGSARDLA